MSEYTEGKLDVGHCENDIAIVSDCNDNTFHKGEGYVMAIMDKPYNNPEYNQKANAAELVRRWNAHEDLVKASEDALKLIGEVDKDAILAITVKRQLEAALAQSKTSVVPSK